MLVRLQLCPFWRIRLIGKSAVLKTAVREGLGVRVPHPPFGAVAQLVRALVCHAGGHGFKSRPFRFAKVAQLVEQLFCKQLATGSSPVFGFSFLSSTKINR